MRSKINKLNANIKEVCAHTKCIQTPSKMSTPTKIGQSHNLNSYARYVSSHQTVPKQKKRKALILIKNNID